MSAAARGEEGKTSVCVPQLAEVGKTSGVCVWEMEVFPLLKGMVFGTRCLFHITHTRS